MLDNFLMAYSNRKRSCGKMCNHFATAPFSIGKSDLRVRGHAGVSRIPRDDGARSQALLHVDGSLVGGAFEEEGDILLFKDEFTIDQDVDAFQKFHSFRHLLGKVIKKIPVIEVAGEAPEVLLRIHFLETGDKGEERLLIGRFHRFAAEEGEAFIEFLSDFLQDVVFSFFGERLSVVEVPCFLVEASLAVMGAAGNEEREADAGAVCNIIFFEIGVVHVDFL